MKIEIEIYVFDKEIVDMKEWPKEEPGIGDDIIKRHRLYFLSELATNGDDRVTIMNEDGFERDYNEGLLQGNYILINNIGY